MPSQSRESKPTILDQETQEAAEELLRLQRELSPQTYPFPVSPKKKTRK